MNVANLGYRGRIYLKQVTEQEQNKPSHIIFQKTQTPPSRERGIPVHWQGVLPASDAEQAGPQANWQLGARCCQEQRPIHSGCTLPAIHLGSSLPEAATPHSKARGSDCEPVSLRSGSATLGLNSQEDDLHCSLRPPLQCGQPSAIKSSSEKAGWPILSLLEQDGP